MVRRDGAVNFLATETLHLFNGKNEGFKPKNTVSTVNQGGGSLVFGLRFSANVCRNLAKINDTMD